MGNEGQTKNETVASTNKKEEGTKPRNFLCTHHRECISTSGRYISKWLKYREPVYFILFFDGLRDARHVRPATGTQCCLSLTKNIHISLQSNPHFPPAFIRLFLFAPLFYTLSQSKTEERNNNSPFSI